MDNNSDDNTAQAVENFQKVFPYNVLLIRNNENYGYTKGCNQGIEIAQGKYVLLLNPDTQIQKDAISKMIDYIESREDVGAIAPQLMTRHKTIQYSCRRIPTYRDLFFEMTLLSKIFSKNKFFAKWKFKYFEHDTIAEVEQPMAAAIMIRKEILNKTGNLDERFLMFYNDIDICKQILNLGYKIIYYPDSKVYHKIGTSILKARVRMIKVWNDDCLRYFRKNGYNSFLHIFLFIGLKISGILRIIFTKLLYK